jgi:hypothetical protein
MPEPTREVLNPMLPRPSLSQQQYCGGRLPSIEKP